MNTLHQAGALSKHAASLLSPLPPLSDLVASVDLASLVEQYAGAYKRNGGGYLFQCPNPAHPDNSPSFSVFTGRNGVQQCGCLSQCGHIGDALSFVEWIQNCDTRQAAEYLRSFAGVAAPREIKPKAPSAPRKLRATQPSGLVDDAQALNDYIASRGWSAEVAQLFGLQIMRDTYGTKRVRHPFLAWVEGQLVEAGWQARRLDNSKELRWLGEKDTPLPLYNLPALDRDDLTHAVICEGVPDTITATLALSTLPGWACVGVAGANGWREEFAQYFGGLKVVIASDNDEGGAKCLAKVAASLDGVASLIVAACPTANDLTDMAKAQSLEAVCELLTGWDIEEKHALQSDTSGEVINFDAVVHAFARCKVCMHEAAPGSRFCKSCARIEEVSGKLWRVCDTCNTFALVELESKCRVSYKCAGYFTEAVTL
jgi:DNA primase